jgi:hypothetical protein
VKDPGEPRPADRYLPSLSTLPDEVIERFSEEVEMVFVLTGVSSPLLPALLLEADRAATEGRPTASLWREWTAALVDDDLAAIENGRPWLPLPQAPPTDLELVAGLEVDGYRIAPTTLLVPDKDPSGDAWLLCPDGDHIALFWRAEQPHEAVVWRPATVPGRRGLIFV